MAARHGEAENYPLEKRHTHSFDVTEAERAMQTLAGAFPEEQAVHIAIVPLLHLSSRASI
jgi:hypothetical protein